ncbi:MAG: hypothetical protein IJQ90_04005 [Alphaproteobacteria bacterium]|nr:hypothetical protein [Alphaproteobacteria bacterium]
MFTTNKIHYFDVYNLNEIGNITNRSEKTVREFIKDSLKTIDNKKPFLVRGYDLIEFLKRKNIKKQHRTNFDEMFCLKCRETRTPKSKQIQIQQKESISFISTRALCSRCGTIMNKAYKISDFDQLKRTFHIVEKLSIYDSDNLPVNYRISDDVAEQENGNNKKEQLCMQIS